MARKSIAMRQLIKLLPHKHEHHISVREIARSSGIAPSTLGDYLQRAERAWLNWPLPEGLSESELEQRLSREGAEPEPAPAVRSAPDWAHVHWELRRPNVTLHLLSQKYHRADPGGLKYGRYCELYQGSSRALEPTLRQVHLPGEKLFVDWTGQSVPIQNPAVGSTHPASLFVAVLGASNKMYVEAFADQKPPVWISAHVHAFGFYSGVLPLTVVNTGTAVVKCSRYEPLLHQTYQEMAEHYGTAIIPARPHRPRDKAKVELPGITTGRNLIFYASSGNFKYLIG